MQLDDLKAVWSAHGAALERSLAIDERLLRETLLRKVRFRLAPYVLCRALEVALGVAVLLAIVTVLGAHLAEPRYLVVGWTLAGFTFWLTALCATLLVGSLRLDYGGPVMLLQSDVERIKLVEYRALKWALLGGVLLWLPFLLVVFEALTGVEGLARVQLPFLVGNLAFGGVVYAAGQAWSKRYVERADPAPWARRVVDALSGRSLRSVSDQLAELSRFVRDESPAPPGGLRTPGA